MSYFDDASLVMIPSGYKTSKVYSVKPTDGSGDLTFTRSNDTATRVGPDGLIEKVRTNLFLQSQTFDNASWNKTSCVVTANAATAPDGTLTAEKIVINNGVLPTDGFDTGILQSSAVLTTGTYTFSVYAKAAEFNILRFRERISIGNYFEFNLSTGTFDAPSNQFRNPTMEAVGNGWYRCSFVTQDNTANTNKYALRVGGTGDGTSGIFIWGAQFEDTDFGPTPYIPTTSAAVSVGPVANVPRLDYLGSSCPRLLLEPQRTNIVTFSEQIDNAAWVKTNATITANASPSPDGYQNADLFVPASGTTGRFEQATSTASANNTTYTGSVYFKKPTLAIDNITFYISDGSSALGSNRFGITVNLTNFTGTAFNFGNGVITSVNVVSVGNDWYRAIFTGSVTSGATGNWVFVVRVLTTNATINGTNGLLIWGAQMELGSYATSYIPTLGAAVTRGADAASKTGISSLIGQTEGTLFAEFTYNGAANTGIYEVIIMVATNTNNLITLVKNDTTSELYAFVINGGVIQVNSVGIAGTNIIGTHKVALTYKLNDYAVYLDGVQVFTDTTATVPTCSGVYVGQSEISTQQLGGTISQAILFPTRLSNSDLAALTA